ncbi:MAG: hypothetical protein KZQ77_15845, partial [Candidatus Thiodiazotropha sp. (ex Notomyrtea botanica)]|nr:hypothetical protein [Candidatus Thiodiazotropha sp. (ex Notomyrtea botanica)]
MMRLSDDNIERIVRSLERHIPEKRNYCLALAAVPNIEAILGLNEKTDAFTGQLPGSGIAKKDLRQKLRAKKKSLVAIKQEIGYIPDHFSEDPQPDMPQHRYWLGLAIATAELTDSDPRDKKVLRDILGKIDDGKRTRRDKVALEHTISRLLREWSKVTGKTPTIWNTEHSDST